MTDCQCVKCRELFKEIRCHLIGDLSESSRMESINGRLERGSRVMMDLEDRVATLENRGVEGKRSLKEYLKNLSLVLGGASATFFLGRLVS